MFEQPLKFLVVFFVVVEPVSLVPLFCGLTSGATVYYRRTMALKAVVVAALILVLFALGGAAFLELMGISLQAFRIFGGMLLFLLSLEMVFARESGTRTSSSEAAESKRRADISVFPLAFPFIAGPGALATILLWFGPLHVGAEPRCSRATSSRWSWCSPSPSCRCCSRTADARDRCHRGERRGAAAGRDPGRIGGAVRARWPAPGVRRRLIFSRHAGRRGPTRRARGARRAVRSASARAPAVSARTPRRRQDSQDRGSAPSVSSIAKA